MKKVKGYWVDKNRNKWDATFYTKDQALGYSISLYKCKDCINCTDCTNCEYCIDCVACHNCLGCSRCMYCKNCNFCTKCRGVSDCNGCENRQSMEFTKKEIKGLKEYLKVCVNGRIMDSLTFIHNGEDYSLSYEFSGLGDVSVCIAKYDYENEDDVLNILFRERFSYSLYDENDEKKTEDEIDDEIIDFTKKALDSIGIYSVEALV